MDSDWKALASMMDTTLLRSNANVAEIEQLCQEAISYSFAAVCVNPIFVKPIAELLQGSKPRVGAVVGFPLGATFSSVKVFELEAVAVAGAQEVDVVMSLASLLSGRADAVREEIGSIVDISKGYGIDTIKVILEMCYLTQEQKVQACELAIEGGAHYVKTSTGFGPAGATVDDVRLLRRVCAGRAKVKAAGGIRTLAQVVEMIEAGAQRIGTSHAGKIVREAINSSTGH
jgi:deoxyribose-phosphate aldolase